MRYGQIREYDVSNGKGIRVSFFVTGCSHNCYNCFNKEYQDPNYGTLWTADTTDYVIELLNKKHVAGLSVLGGEPFQSAKELQIVLADIKKEINNDIWVWSGYTIEEILEDEDMYNLLKEIDVLIDGRFVQRLRDLTLQFRGSSNQRIIDVKKTLEKGEIVLYL